MTSDRSPNLPAIHCDKGRPGHPFSPLLRTEESYLGMRSKTESKKERDKPRPKMKISWSHGLTRDSTVLGRGGQEVEEVKVILSGRLKLPYLRR